MVQNIWDDFLKIVKQEAGSRIVDTWFRAVTLRRWDPGNKTVYLQAPNRFVCEWIQGKYSSLISVNLERLFSVNDLKVVFEITNEKQKEETVEVVSKSTEIIPAVAVKKKNLPVRSARTGDYINASHTFETFVVGSSNSLAYAAAKAITEKPGRLYNPLFLYGDSGLGKTHLLHAIGNEVKKKYEKVGVLYQTADRFVNEFIYAIRFDKVHKFKAKYKSVDILLIDDIQFISNKEQTQEAFFHIFNSLYDAHKQIVFSSDNIPQDISGLADRLCSRLACGLVADVRLPELETRVAIIKKKAEANNEFLSDDVAHFIASRMVPSVRELEGSLIRVMAFASLTKQPITLDLAKKVLEYTARPQKQRTIDFNSVVKCLVKYYRYNLSELKSKARNKELSFVRQVAMFLMKEVTNKSLREIGYFLGGRDHSTVMHALSKVKKHAQINETFGCHLNTMKQEILSGK